MNFTVLYKLYLENRIEKVLYLYVFVFVCVCVCVCAVEINVPLLFVW